MYNGVIENNPKAGKQTLFSLFHKKFKKARKLRQNWYFQCICYYTLCLKNTIRYRFTTPTNYMLVFLIVLYFDCKIKQIQMNANLSNLKVYKCLFSTDGVKQCSQNDVILSIQYYASQNCSKYK